MKHNVINAILGGTLGLVLAELDGGLLNPYVWVGFAAMFGLIVNSFIHGAKKATK